LLSVWILIHKDIPEWQFVIVGGSLSSNNSNANDYQNIELARLKSISDSLNLKQLIFTGNQDPFIYYKESSIFCLSSNYEGLPMVFIEAIQYGLVPVLLGEFCSIIRFNTSWL